jgi:hypothetical protein
MGSGEVTATLEVCLKAPLRTAIWLQSTDNRAIGATVKRGREVDIAEIYTSGLDHNFGLVTHTVHAGGYGVMHTYAGSLGTPLAICERHIYGVRFDSSGYRFYVDGKRRWILSDGFQGRNEYLIFSVEAPKNVRYDMTGASEQLGYARLVAARADRTPE